MKKSYRSNVVFYVFIIIFLFAGFAFAEDAIFIDGDGNIGIGTASPTMTLDVRGPIRSMMGPYFDVWLQGGDSSDPSDNRNLAILGRSEDSGDKLYINWAGEYANGTILGGNVGIGTDSPTMKLDVRGPIRQTTDSNCDVWIQGGASSWGEWGDDRNLAIVGLDEDSGDRLYINWGGEYEGGTNLGGNVSILGGNVGIGYAPESMALIVVEYDSDIALFSRNEQESTNNIAVYAETRGAGVYNYGLISSSYGFGQVNYGIVARAVNGSVENYAGYFDGLVYGTNWASFAKVIDRTPYYEGDALSEILKISGKDGEIDHSTLPDFAHLDLEVPVFEESELAEITSDEAFETVQVERDKVVESEDENGKSVKRKIKKGVKKISKGYQVENGKVKEIIEKTPIYEKEFVEKKQLRKNVYLDEKTGKLYQKAGEGEIFEKEGKVWQQNQTGTKIEEQRDIGAMVTILTVAVQQLDEENKELRNENDQLKDRLDKIEKMLASKGQGNNTK